MPREFCLICQDLGHVHNANVATEGYDDRFGRKNLYCEERKFTPTTYDKAERPDWEWLSLQKLLNNGLWEYYYDLYSKWR